jgi:hypothetical protein
MITEGVDGLDESSDAAREITVVTRFHQLLRATGRSAR